MFQDRILDIVKENANSDMNISIVEDRFRSISCFIKFSDLDYAKMNILF